jgi:hypothetical protein
MTIGNQGVITLTVKIPISCVSGTGEAMATSIFDLRSVDQILLMVQGLVREQSAQSAILDKLMSAQSNQTSMLGQLLAKETQIMAAIDNLETAVGEVKTVADSVEMLLDKLHQELQDAIASGDPARVQAAVDMLSAQRQRLVDAVMRNTDVAPAPQPPQPGP